jgi:hypothetical protein
LYFLSFGRQKEMTERDERFYNIIALYIMYQQSTGTAVRGIYFIYGQILKKKKMTTRIKQKENNKIKQKYVQILNG